MKKFDAKKRVHPNGVDRPNERMTLEEKMLLGVADGLELGGKKVLVAGNRSGWLPLEILKKGAELKAHAFDFHHARAIRDRLAENGVETADCVVCAAGVPEGDYDVAFFMTTPQSMPAELVLDQLEDIHARLAPGGMFYAAFEGDADQALKTLRLVWSNVRVVTRTKRGGLFAMTKKSELAKRRDFSSEWTASVPGGAPLTFTTYPGCFCHRRADAGGLALAEVAAREAKAEDKLLDMGCGCGLVGILVAAHAGITDTTFIDSHARAIAATEVNAARAGLAGVRTILTDDGLPRGESGKWDLVVGNPPYYSDYRIAEIFMETAYRALKPGGRCLMVVKTATGLLALQEKYFRTAEVVKRRGYCVLRSIRV